MIVLLRLIGVILFSIVTFVVGCLYCIFSPRNFNQVHHIGRFFSRWAPLFGIKLIFRIPEEAKNYGPSIYIANHQNNFDMCTVSGATMPRTVTVGKKSLVWLPLFGQLYWLSGNILIDRNNRSKAAGTINQVVDRMKKDKLSVWMFPEGTRSRGRGLLPFKTGAFHAALGAQVPIVPIVCSSTSGLKLNRWNNGYVIVEMLPPIPTEGCGKEDLRRLMEESHAMMAAKLAELDAEVAELNKK